MRWLRFVDDDFWKMLSRFLLVLLLVIGTIHIVQKISVGNGAVVSMDCIKGECLTDSGN
jgi:flagellar biogenesis protein FliO